MRCGICRPLNFCKLWLFRLGNGAFNFAFAFGIASLDDVSASLEDGILRGWLAFHNCVKAVDIANRDCDIRYDRSVIL